MGEEEEEEEEEEYDVVRAAVQAEMDAAIEEEGGGAADGSAAGDEETDRLARCRGGSGSTVHPCTPEIRDGMNSLLQQGPPATLQPPPPEPGMLCKCGMPYAAAGGQLRYVEVREYAVHACLGCTWCCADVLCPPRLHQALGHAPKQSYAALS